MKGTSIFYAGSMGLLPNSIEIQPSQGQFITNSKWKIKNGVKLKLFIVCQDPELAMKNQEIIGDYNLYLKFLAQIHPSNREIVEKIMAFIVSAFTRKVSPDKKQGYLFSALIAELLFQHPTDSCDAIYYPSVPNDSSSMNIAILPNSLDIFFDFHSAEEMLIKSHIENKNIWGGIVTGRCNSIDSHSLNLNWNDN